MKMISFAFPKWGFWTMGWLSVPGRPVGWRVLLNLLGQNEFPVPGDAKIIFLILVHDHDLVAPLK
jgi:hypothetical protein